MSEPLPFVSVIMPIRNEERFIAESLGAVLAQDYPHDRMEVIVADGMSTDKTRDIIQAIASDHPNLTIHVLDNHDAIVPSGFNLALARTVGEVIVWVDGHTVIARDYIRQCVDALKRTGADNVGGRMNAVSSNFLGKVVAYATSSPFGVGNARFHFSQEEEWVDTVYMGAWRREVFERIGGFDDSFIRNQDDEFNYRLRAHGGKILLCPRIKSTYYNRSTPYSLFKQYYQYGMYKIRVMQKHPRQMQWRHFVPFGLVAVLTGSFVGTLLIESFAVLLAAILTTYGVANLVTSVWLARKSRWVYLIFLPLIFVILHFSYGLGFARGLIKFWSHWRGERLHVAEAEY